MSASQGVSLAVACDRLGFSVRTGRRLLAEGNFPVPELPRLSARAHHRFSTVHIENYLVHASVADARPRRLRVVGGSAHV